MHKTGKKRDQKCQFSLSTLHLVSWLTPSRCWWWWVLSFQKLTQHHTHWATEENSFFLGCWWWFFYRCTDNLQSFLLIGKNRVELALNIVKKWLTIKHCPGKAAGWASSESTVLDFCLTSHSPALRSSLSSTQSRSIYQVFPVHQLLLQSPENITLNKLDIPGLVKVTVYWRTELNKQF